MGQGRKKIKHKRSWLRFLLLVLVAFVLGYLWRGGGSETESTGAGEHGEAAGEQKPTVWTCSMHPQIQLPKAGKCPICFMDLIPLEDDEGDSDSDNPRRLSMSESARKLAEIVTAPVMRRKVAGDSGVEVRMVGKIDYDETRVKIITTWMPGRLDKLYVDFTGVTVKKGQPLADIYSPELYTAQEELLQAIQAVERLSRSDVAVIRDTAQSTVKAVREKLRLLGLSPKQIEEIEQNGTPLEHITIHAPMGGVVVHKNAFEGSYVDTGTEIYRIADLSIVWVVFDAYESDLPLLRLGQPVEFTAEAAPGRTFTGKISFIDPFLQDSTRTVRVRAEASNGGGLLKPDMFVRGVAAGQPRAANRKEAPLVIPATAPLITGRRAVVYVEVPDKDRPTYEGREVTLGPRAGDFYVVADGLEEGEQVVVNGNFKIDSALQIQAKPSMMSPEGGVAPAGHQHGSAGSSGMSATAEHEQSAPLSVPREFRESLAGLYADYFVVHEGLYKDDPASTKKALAALVKTAEGVDMASLKGDTHDRWMSFLARIKKHGNSGIKSSDLETIRQTFFDLSKVFLELEGQFGHAGSVSHYEAYCPMAFGDKGASWLQKEKQISNPYFGAQMLRCGEIRNTFEVSD